MCVFTLFVRYHVRKHEAAEEVPHHVERGCNDGSHVVVGRDGDGHHSEEGEVEQREVHEE